ncbi:hypothetical protein AB1L88_17055 [Tautonia sp. JC769]|uniref:hypothetical protein n=1 Tax=Tautonia sp. JC769 TaxID=3232135 RepID=UPI0034581803
MAGEPTPTPNTDMTPEALRKAKGDFDPSKLSQEGQQHGTPEAQGEHQPSAAELAEQQRRDEKGADGETRTRDDRLVTAGRGHHTAGRLGGVK